MSRFKSGISFSIVLAGILAGLGAAILHPYVHALHETEFVHSTHTEIPGENQGFTHIDSADHCYVCTFSKKLAFGDTVKTEFKLTLHFNRSIPFPFLFGDNGFEPVIFLRGPPLA